MDEQTRKAIEEVLGWAHEGRSELWVALDFLRESLAREAEHATPVSPEWLDGAEGKRLGFERRLPNFQPEWVCNGGSEADGVTVILNGHGRHTRWFVWFGGQGIGRAGIPTIRQVRLAVELATGRR